MAGRTDGKHATAAEAALAGFPAAADARVVGVTVVGDRAEVVLQVGPDYDYWVYCHRHGGGWAEVASGNGPSQDWADPDVVFGP